MKRQTLIEDARRMEDAACDLMTEHRVSLGKIVYWLCVAVLHLIEWSVSHYDAAGGSKEELKPCPFCGETPYLYQSKRKGYGYWKIFCCNNDCVIRPSTQYMEKSKLIDAWNRRGRRADT